MRRKAFVTAFVGMLACGVWAGGRAPDAPRPASGAATRPASRPASGPAPAATYLPVTPAQRVANEIRAGKLADRTREAVASELRLLETAHFLIYTNRAKTSDRFLTTYCESLYRSLRRRLHVPGGTPIWAGKCPVFLFATEDQYENFCRDVADRGTPTGSGHYAVTGDFVYLAIRAAKSTTRIREVLAHEATHAFLSRYVSTRPLPKWVNEGLAEHVAATMVPGCAAAHRWLPAVRLALTRNKDVSSVLRDVRLDSFDYGIAQSFVRFLIERSPTRFMRLVRRLKAGRDTAGALADSFVMTEERFLAAWGAWARLKARRR